MCHHLLAVAQLGDALRHAAGLLGRQLQSQLLQVARNVGAAAGLAHGILASATEALGHERVVVQAALLVAVGMDAGHLCEHVVANDGLVGSNGNAAVALHQAADVVQPVFAYVGVGVELVLQDDLHAG